MVEGHRTRRASDYPMQPRAPRTFTETMFHFQFRILQSDELPPGATLGLAFTTVSIKPTRYLPWLKKELVDRDITFIVKSVGSVEEAASYGGDDSILINASGLGTFVCRQIFILNELNS